METSALTGLLVSRNELFARTLKFLTSPLTDPRKDSHWPNCANTSYSEECYIICTNVDVGRNIDISSSNAVIPCTCHFHHASTSGSEGGSNDCAGQKLVASLTADMSPFVAVKDSDYFIYAGCGPGGEGQADGLKKDTWCGLYRRESKCRKVPVVATEQDTASSSISGSDTKSEDHATKLPGAQLVTKYFTDVRTPQNNGNSAPVEYFLKQIRPELKSLSYHSTPSAEGDIVNICHMNISGQEEFEERKNADYTKKKSDKPTDVYIVWYKGAAKFFTIGPQGPSPIPSSSQSFIDMIRAGHDPREQLEYRNEVIRGVVPFDRNSPLPCAVTKWDFSDYIQHINAHAKALVERIERSLVCVNDYLNFRFLWIEHSFILLCLVYVKQGVDQELRGSCLVNNLWQPTIITPNTINLLFKNALISLSSYLEFMSPRATNDYYIYQGLPSGNVNLMAGLGGLSETNSNSNSGGSSPHVYSNRASRLNFPVWWNFYADRCSKGIENDGMSGSNSPNSRLQRYTEHMTEAQSLGDSGGHGHFGSCLTSDSYPDHNTSAVFKAMGSSPHTPLKCEREECRATPASACGGYGQLKIEAWENEYASPEKLFSTFTIKSGQDAATITPTTTGAHGHVHDQEGADNSMSCEYCASYDKELSFTAYASSQSYDKSLLSELNISTNASASNDNSPVNCHLNGTQPPIAAPTGTRRAEVAGSGCKCYCSSCGQFGTIVIPILDKDGVMAYTGVGTRLLLDGIFSTSGICLIDGAFLETKVEESAVMETHMTAKSKAKGGKSRGGGAKKLLGMAGLTAKSLKDALKSCETLKQTIRRKLPFDSPRRLRNIKQARDAIERVYLTLENALENVSKAGHKLSDTLGAVFEEIEEEDLAAPKDKSSPAERAGEAYEWCWSWDACHNSDCSTELDFWGPSCGKDEAALDDVLSPRIISDSGTADESVFVSPSFSSGDVTFSWEEHQPVEEHRKWMLYNVDCGSPLTRSKAKKQGDKRASPRSARMSRSLKKRHGDEEFEEYDFDTDFEETKVKRTKKQSPGAIDYANNSGNQKALVPMGPLPIGVYFDASRKLWRCQWRENGKFKTKGFSLSHYKTLADARHACILYRCEVGNMAVQPEWLNPVFVQVGSLAHKKVAGKIE
ncbi:AP2/ERF domain-containing protein PFD0985w [Babesia microti strain RI]|uniref:AP2/ERF domain-containing protein PFD0985w n=1 Tax=Babesia microti (strain RI) TaxID=1133968 RepID=I7I8S3_BABMR|nr:AP2/ERF domain-containing protein PFD0985w [Babesia microti strain RI]CCF73588.1 AP2/ERF domain-containing protein PFD0985w [Babesia microti strain RI]|eukprot:XP_012648197.1 AP2/ERF domain-containing protein PFD0985w [Babesia microti strain RI]